MRNPASIIICPLVGVFGLTASGVNAAQEVEIALTGEIERECSIEQSPASITLGALERSGSRSFPLRVRCNAPFSYDIASSAGGLVLKADAETDGFLNFVPYEIESTIPTDTGVINDICPSADIIAGQEICALSDSGTGIAMPSDASFEIRWREGTRPLLAGEYEDQITISFAVRP